MSKISGLVDGPCGKTQYLNLPHGKTMQNKSLLLSSSVSWEKPELKSTQFGCSLLLSSAAAYYSVRLQLTTRAEPLASFQAIFKKYIFLLFQVWRCTPLHGESFWGWSLP